MAETQHKVNYEEIPSVETRSGLALQDVDFAALVDEGKPVLIKALLRDRPLVQHGLKSPAAAMEHLSTFDSGRTITAYRAEPDRGGRFGYTEDATALDFDTHGVLAADFFAVLEVASGEVDPAAHYIGSTDVEAHFPGLIDNERISLPGAVFERHPPLVGIWMGNRTTAAAHYDMSNNVAACMVGKRRFTLFPPDQISNLYPGPLFPTPGGQVVSMVDFDNPDPDQHPDFAKAVASAQVADMEPGDVLVYPAMWWHRVDALESFNVLINYWWNDVPNFLDSPMDTVLHAMLSLRDRPMSERQAWKSVFDHYVFGEADTARKHLPTASHGPLAELDTQTARRLRMMLQQKLNR